MSNKSKNKSRTIQNTITNTPASDPTNNRWWENYLVRYLVPSIVGMFILILLNRITDDSIKNLLFSFYANKSENKLSNTILIIWFLLGTGFCYIASYPILALHVLARFSYKNKQHYIHLKQMTMRISRPIICSLMLFMLNNFVVYFFIIKSDPITETIKIMLPIVVILISICILSISYTHNIKNCDKKNKVTNITITVFGPGVVVGAIIGALIGIIVGFPVGLFGLWVEVEIGAGAIIGAVAGASSGAIIIGAIIGSGALLGVRIETLVSIKSILKIIITTGTLVGAILGVLIGTGVAMIAGAGIRTIVGAGLVTGISTIIIIIIIKDLLNIFQQSQPFPKTYFDKLKIRYRIKDTKPNINITESYKHLREHGNTALIIILEVILAICLYAPLKYIDFKNHEAISFGILTITILALIAWLIPAVIIYFFGHALESEHVGK